MHCTKCVVPRGRAAMLTALLAILKVREVLSGEHPVAPVQPDGVIGPFTLDEFTSVNYFPNTFTGVWINDHEFWYPNRWSRDVVIHSMETNISTAVMPNQLANLFQYDHVHSFSKDMKYVVAWDNRISIYGNSNLCAYTLINVATGQQTQLGPGLLQLVVWSGENDIIYVYENNIYLIKNASTGKKRLEGSSITTSGDSLHYNGVATWVYDEEILGTDKALWPSPDGKWLAFLFSDESMVPEVSFMHYGEPGSMKFQYPRVIKRRYPKVGQKNPTVRLLLAELNPDPLQRLKPFGLPVPKEVTEDYILLGCAWLEEGRLIVSWTNRLQNTVVMVNCDTKGKCYDDKIILENTVGWVTSPPLSVTRGNRLATILSSNSFKHLAVVWWSAGTAKTVFLTSGEQSVIDVLMWDDVDDYLYFRSAYLVDPAIVHVYRVHVPPASASYPYPAWDTKQDCISCVMVSPEGMPCLHADASFSKNGSRVALDCRGPGSPFIELYELKVRSSQFPNPKIPFPQSPRPVRHSVFDDNIELRLKLRNKISPEPKDYWLKWTDAAGAAKARVRLWLPPSMDSKRASDISPSNYSLILGSTFQPTNSVYIERFMGMPTKEDNWHGYREADLTVNVENFRRKKFLLMHGTEDDNVHFQHTMALVRVLESKNILFQEQTYPDESHSIAGMHTHLYRTMDKFWTQCFGE